jgi:hypothetical protein
LNLLLEARDFFINLPVHVTLLSLGRADHTS